PPAANCACMPAPVAAVKPGHGTLNSDNDTWRRRRSGAGTDVSTSEAFIPIHWRRTASSAGASERQTSLCGLEVHLESPSHQEGQAADRPAYGESCLRKRRQDLGNVCRGDRLHEALPP